jgi:predicted RNase H-like nuclease (RuvC/YqgF family)
MSNDNNHYEGNNVLRSMFDRENRRKQLELEREIDHLRGKLHDAKAKIAWLEEQLVKLRGG